MSDLANRHCEPCRGDVPQLTLLQCESLASELHDRKVVEGHHLACGCRAKDLAGALAQANRFGVTTWTHKIDGPTRSDFVLAAKYEALVAASAGETS